ncbi:hypothetical protein JCM3766R1_005326 [Sporobolomyces carnicolor]
MSNLYDGANAWLLALHSLLNNPPDMRSLYWKADQSFALRATSEVPYDELRRFGIISMETLIAKLTQFGFLRVSEEKLVPEERANFHVFIDYSGAFVPFDSRAVHLMRPVHASPFDHREVEAPDLSPTGSIVDHWKGLEFDEEELETTPSKAQSTSLRHRSRPSIGLDMSTSRLEIRRRLEDHRDSLSRPTDDTLAQETLGPRFVLPPDPMLSSSSRYRNELFDSVSTTSPSDHTPALSRSTSSDCSLSPFPFCSSQSSPWTPWPSDLESFAFPNLTILEDTPFAAFDSKPIQPFPWSWSNELGPSRADYPLIPSAVVVDGPIPLSHGNTIVRGPQRSIRDFGTIPSCIAPFPRGLGIENPLGPSSHSQVHGGRVAPPEIVADPTCRRSFDILEAAETPRPFGAFDKSWHSAPLPTYEGAERTFLDPVREGGRRGGGGRKRRREDQMAQTQPREQTRPLLRPLPIRSSPLRPHPYQSPSRTIHSRRDNPAGSLNSSSVRQLERIASPTPTSFVSPSRDSLDTPDASSRTAASWSSTRRRSGNASLERILNPPRLVSSAQFVAPGLFPVDPTSCALYPPTIPSSAPMKRLLVSPIKSLSLAGATATSAGPRSFSPFSSPTSTLPSIAQGAAPIPTGTVRGQGIGNEIHDRVALTRHEASAPAPEGYGIASDKTRSFGTLSDLFEPKPVLLPHYE